MDYRDVIKQLFMAGILGVCGALAYQFRDLIYAVQRHNVILEVLITKQSYTDERLRQLENKPER